MVAHSPFIEYEGIPILDIPVIGVQYASREYLIPPIWSVIQYFANSFPDPGVRRGTVTMSRDDLRDTIVTDEGGARPKQEVFTFISNQVRQIEFTLESWALSAPRELTDHAREHIDRHCPLIAFVDGLQLQRETDQAGPIYSVVVTGINDAESVVIDPVAGRRRVLSNRKLDEIWDPEYHQLVTIEPVGEYTTRGDHQ